MRKLAVTALALLSLSACATIMHGTSQDVGLSSSPSAAKVTVDNVPLGNTPLITKLSRKDNHIVKFEMDGYAPFEATMTRGVSGWVWGNLVFGGLIGLAVDAVSGGLYKVSPDQLQATLSKQGASVTRDGLYVLVVMQPDPTWQKVAQLERE
jgi:hypothetical protein